MLDVEADDQSAGVVVGAGADRGAEARILKGDEQRGRHHDGADRRVKLGGVDDDRANLVAVEGIADLHVLGILPEQDSSTLEIISPMPTSSRNWRCSGLVINGLMTPFCST